MKVSIIIPCYNAGDYLSQTLNCISSQSHKNFELIVVDDGSTDNSLDILNTFAEKNSYAKIITQPNSGKPSSSRNRALKEANGEVILFLDSDDLISINRLEKVVTAFIENPTCSVVLHDFDRISNEGSLLKDTVIGSRWDSDCLGEQFQPQNGYLVSVYNLYFAFLEKFSFLNTNTIALRAADFDSDELMFDEELLFAEDLQKWCELIREKKVVYLPEVLSSYRDTAGSLTEDQLSADIAAVLFLKRHLNKPLQKLDEKTIVILKKRILKELKDCCFLASKAGSVTQTIEFALEIIRQPPYANNFIFSMKCLSRCFFNWANQYFLQSRR